MSAVQFNLTCSLITLTFHDIISEFYVDLFINRYNGNVGNYYRSPFLINNKFNNIIEVNYDFKNSFTKFTDFSNNINFDLCTFNYYLTFYKFYLWNEAFNHYTDNTVNINSNSNNIRKIIFKDTRYKNIKITNEIDNFIFRKINSLYNNDNDICNINNNYIVKLFEYCFSFKSAFFCNKLMKNNITETYHFNNKDFVVEF